MAALQTVAAELTADTARQQELVAQALAHLLHLRVSQPAWSETARMKECAAFVRASLQTPDTVRFESLTESQVAAIQPRITRRQQDVLNLLRQGHGLRETGRRLGISHVAVLKHRRKIEGVTPAVLHTLRLTTPRPATSEEVTPWLA